MPSKLVWLRGTQIGVEYALSSATISLGRSADNTIAVGSERASRRHAEVRRDAGGYLLVDLNSANGTLVNGARISEPYRLNAGDLFEIGDELFRFEAADVISATVLPNVRPAVTAPEVNSAGTPTIRPLNNKTEPITTPRRRMAPILIIVLILIIALVAAIGVYVATSRAGGVPPILPALAATAPALKVAPIASSQSPPTTWTILVYMAGDNDLEADALRDMNEMELVGSSDQLHLIVQLDRAGRAGSGEVWASTRRYRIQQDNNPEQINSTLLADLGELNTGDPQHLADFIVWGLKTYPAEHTALVIWDHGSAWAGTAFDLTSANDGLSMPELQQALTTAQTQLDGHRFDAFGFDACLMGQLDVLLAVAPYADTLVASAELEPSSGWDWGALLAQVGNGTVVDGRSFGSAAVETYATYYQAQGNSLAMLAAFESTRINDLARHVGRFADAIQVDLDQSYRPFAEARAYTIEYSQPRPEEFSAIDLGDLAQRVIQQGAPESVAGPARDILAGITASRSAYWSAAGVAQASGISVYLPQQQALLPAAYDQASPLAQQTSWGRMLQAFLAAGSARVALPTIGNLQVATSGQATNLTGTVAGRDIAAVYFFVGIPFADRSGVQLVLIDALRPPDGAEIWGAGPYRLRSTWNGDQWGLRSGDTTIPVLLGPARPGGDLYGVEGYYTNQQSGQATQAALLFRVMAEQAAFLSVYVFPRETGQAAQPFEVQPLVGDAFATQIRTYTLAGDGLIRGSLAGEQISFAEQPLQAVRLPVPAGAYVVGFLVRDITGRLSYQYTDLTIGP
jgi:hypothetical protein